MCTQDAWGDHELALLEFALSRLILSVGLRMLRSDSFEPLRVEQLSKRRCQRGDVLLHRWRIAIDIVGRPEIEGERGDGRQ